MLTKEQIKANKETFLEKVKEIDREGADIEGLIDWLEKSDFFEAPASTKYHAGYAGGLCEHSLNVYNALCTLNESMCELAAKWELIDDNSLLIAALFHDISKAKYYETSLRNVDTGEKDEKGKNIWIKVPEYRVKDAKDRFIYGNHEQNSEFMIRHFIPLTLEESAAIINHHGGMGFDSSQVDLTPIYNRYSLACLLHLADMMATYLIERLPENE